MKLMNAAVRHYSKIKYYFFRGEYYLRYTHSKGIDQNYPRKISDGWYDLWNVFPGPYDVAMLRNDGARYYFFKGEQYVRYKPGTGLDPNYPKDIDGNWHDLWTKLPGPYDAAFYAKQNGKYYFFKGSSYIRYTHGIGVDPGYPKSIVDHWYGLWDYFPGPYDCVCDSPDSDDIYYFFKGEEYVRYRRGVGIDNVPGNGHWVYPHSTAYMWPGLWMLKPFSALTIGGFSTNGPIFSIRLLENATVSMDPIAGLSLNHLRTITNANLPGFTKVYQLEGMNVAQEETIRLRTSTDDIGAIKLKNLPAIGDRVPLTFAIGSCFDDARHIVSEIPTVKNIQAESPDFMIWNGDTSYYIGLCHDKDSGSVKWLTCKKGVTKRGDMRNQRLMFLRMYKSRLHPTVAQFMQAIPSISTWDDHDFGFNNTGEHNMSVQQIQDATEVFRTCWPNNYSKTEIDQSIEHGFRYGAAEFFCPDTRTYRNKQEHVILGDAQLQDLIRAMRNSNAIVKVLVLSSQLIAPKRPGEGFFHSSIKEHTLLLNAMTNGTIPGRILIVSGDVHYSELSYYGGTPEAPSIVEITSSPMLLKVDGKFSEPSLFSRSRRIWSAMGNSYAMIRITFVNFRPRIEIRVRDSSGTPASIYLPGGGIGVNWREASAIWDEQGNLVPA